MARYKSSKLFTEWNNFKTPTMTLQLKGLVQEGFATPSTSIAQDMNTLQ